MTILAIGFVHLSNRYTLSSLLRRDLGDAGWLADRRPQVREVALACLTRGRAA